MAKNIYVGNRYVPKFDGTWSNLKEYESLTIVSWGGNSFTSKINVPIGIDINNVTYWECTGNYNEQVEIYRQDVLNYNNNVLEVQNDVDTFHEDIELIKTRMDNIVINPKDFGVVADGVTDDTVALQNAFNAVGGSIKIVGQIYITDSIIIDGKKNIIGDTSLTSGVSEIKLDSSVKKPIFVSSPSAYCGHTIKNITFRGYSGIDARSNSVNIIKFLNVSECGFYNESVFGGIGIQLLNTDFSKIRDCHFQTKFYCGIRCSGWIDSVYTINKNSTQVKIDGCSFILNDSRGCGAISFEQIDSCHVKDCDFCCSTIAAVDVGGKIFNQNIPLGELYYIPNQSNNVNWFGSCTYSDIKDSHFENFNTGIYVDGGNLEYCHGIVIEDNNFQTFRNNSVAIHVGGIVFGLHTKSNYMDFADISSAKGIYLDGTTWNSFIENDYIVGLGVAFSGDGFSVNSNVLWRRKTGGQLRNIADFKGVNLRVADLKLDTISNIESIKTDIPDVNMLVNNKAEVFVPITKFFQTNNGTSSKIYDFGSCTEAVGILILSEFSSMGSMNLVCAFNGTQVTKISGNGMDVSSFDIIVDNTGITYKQNWTGGACDHNLVGSVMLISR